MPTLAITRVTANTLATAAGVNSRSAEIEAVVNALDGDNCADDAITAAKLNADVVRSGYGLIQHTDGSLYVDVSDTNSGLEISDGGLRAKVYGLASRTSNGIDIGRSGDLLLSSSGTTPDGWSDVSATYADKFIRISATALSTGGSDTHSHGSATGSHTLTTDEIPAHTHTIKFGTGAAYADGGPRYTTGSTETVTSESTGGGSGHTHTITSADNIPAYVTTKMYQKT